ncbi:TonB-dependent receptor [Mucilaginibacter sp. PAMB04274]|uniref:TonB-dependent receptor n=1 Tax=Mucilaginibacter sp. PAMB04274 TaxID=3138568 RepID=UPI0031F6AB0A
MNKFFLTAILVLCLGSVFAQNKSHVKGTIVDSTGKKPMEMVTIGITDLKDSSFVSYTVTNKTGKFALYNLPSGKPIAVIASYVGYANFGKVVTLKQGDTLNLGNIIMRPEGKMLGEVTVTAQRQAIVIKKDTVEFNVAAFKVRPNAVVEELLKRLPGVQVDFDGSIKVNGKAISKITIDGKEFFANDPRVASKNIDVSLLDKVQIFDDRENDPDHLIEEANVSKIINLKFKKALKKSVFGKMYAGGGSRERFESGGLFNMFRDTLQMSFIGVGNNLNRTGFSDNDLSQYGGFDRSGEDALYNGSVGVGGNNWNGGIEKVISAGLNLNNDYGKKLKLNLLYFFNNSKVTNISTSLNQQNFPTDTLFTLTNNNTLTNTNKHNVNGLVVWNPNDSTNFRYTPKLNFANNFNRYDNTSNRYNYLNPLNQSIGNNSNDGSRMQFQHNFSYYHKLGKRYGSSASLNVNHSLNISPDLSSNINNLDLISQTSTVKSEQLRRLIDVNSRNTNASLSVAFRYPLSKKLTGDVTASGGFIRNGRLQQTFDQNLQTGEYSLYLENQSSDLDRYQWTESGKANLNFKFNKRVSIDAGVTAEWLQILNRFHKNVPDLNQYYLNWLPSARLRIGNSSLSYSSSVSQPSVYNLQPITIQSSQLYRFTGNPLLRPTRRHSVSVNFYKYYPQSQLNIYSYLNSSFEENSVTSVTQLTPEGASANTPVNRNGRRNVNGNVGVNKTFKTSKTWQLNISSSAYFSSARNFFILNQDEGFQNNLYLGFTQGINLGWKEIVQLNSSYSLRPQTTTYSGVDFASVKFVSHSADNRFTVRWPKRMYWEGVYSYSYNPLASAGFQKSVNMLNLSVAVLMLKKDRGEIKLSCYDMLDQNISAYRYSGANSIVDSQNQILKRYFLLTYMVKFNKMSTK